MYSLIDLRFFVVRLPFQIPKAYETAYQVRLF